MADRGGAGQNSDPLEEVSRTDRVVNPSVSTSALVKMATLFDFIRLLSHESLPLCVQLVKRNCSLQWCSQRLNKAHWCLNN